jgi:hypothetical protein
MNEMSEERLKEWDCDWEWMLRLERGKINELTDEIRRLRTVLASGLHLPEVDLAGEIESHLNPLVLVYYETEYRDTKSEHWLIIGRQAINTHGYYKGGYYGEHKVRAFGPLVLKEVE